MHPAVRCTALVVGALLLLAPWVVVSILSGQDKDLAWSRFWPFLIVGMLIGIALITTGAIWSSGGLRPLRKVEAIKIYRDQYGVGLAEAKRAVEEYMKNG
jgi:hypothetical protein